MEIGALKQLASHVPFTVWPVPAKTVPGGRVRECCCLNLLSDVLGINV